MFRSRYLPDLDLRVAQNDTLVLIESEIKRASKREAHLLRKAIGPTGWCSYGASTRIRLKRGENTLAHKSHDMIE